VRPSPGPRNSKPRSNPPPKSGAEFRWPAVPTHLRTRPCVSRRLLCHMLDAKDLDGARAVDHPIEGNVVCMQHEFANVGRQPRPAFMAEQRVLGQRLHLLAQLLAECARTGRTVLGDVANDAAQVFQTPWGARRCDSRPPTSVPELRPPGLHDGLELGLVAQAVGVAVHAADQAEHGRHVGHDVGVQRPQRGQIEGPAAACVPPGQQKVRDDAGSARSRAWRARAGARAPPLPRW
jgi:hypothetical protein